MVITKATLDELARLHAAANLPEFISILSATIRVHPQGPDLCSADEHESSLAAIHNIFPALLARLEAAEAERDERVTMAARAQEALRYVLNGLPATDAVWAAYGNADSARAWLTARDARMKREGAAEWLENAARDGGYYERSSEGMLEEAKQLREGKV